VSRKRGDNLGEKEKPTATTVRGGLLRVRKCCGKERRRGVENDPELGKKSSKTTRGKIRRRLGKGKVARKG